MILRLCEREGLPKLKMFMDEYHNKSSTQLRTAIQAGQQHPLPARKDGPDTATPVLTDSLTSTIKTFKEAMQQIAAIGLTFATAVDAKVTGPEQFFLDSVERIVLVLTGLLS